MTITIQDSASRDPWFTNDAGEERANALVSAGRALWRTHAGVRSLYDALARMYGNPIDVSDGATSFALPSINAVESAPTINKAKSVVDTFVSNTSQVTIRPMFLTNRGNWDDMQKAKRLQKFVDGGLYVSGFRELEPLLLRDAAVFGSYFVKWRAEKQANQKWKPVAERVIPYQILFDPRDARFGKPTMLIQRSVWDRRRLMALFPKQKKAIAAANSFVDEHAPANMMEADFADLIEVFEGWHLPSAPGADDGVYCVAIDDAELTAEEDREYTDPRFPFTRFCYEEPNHGYLGTGIVQQVFKVQQCIDDLFNRISEGIETVAVPRIGLSNGAEIVKSELTDEPGTVVRSSGDPPIPLVWPGMSQDVYMHFRWAVDMPEALAGFSTLDTQAIKPAGLNSGAAQRAYADITAKRQTERLKRREQATCDAAKQLIALFRRCAAADPKFSLTFRGKHDLEEIVFKDVDLDDDAYDVQCFSSSFLPLEPGARIQAVNEMAQNGYLSRAETRFLIDMPDLSALNELEVAPFELVLDRLHRMVETGKYLPPDGTMDADLALKLGLKFLNLIEIRGASDESQGLIRRFVVDVERMLSKNAAPPPPAGPPMMPGAPGGAPPMPPPPMPGA